MVALARQSFRSPTVRVALLSAAMAAAAALVCAAGVEGAGRPAGTPAVPYWVLAIAFFLAEAYPVHLHFRREAHSLSLGDFALVLGLFTTSPLGLVLTYVVGAGAALLLVRRQRPTKLAFNLAQFGLGAAVALAVFHGVVAGREAYGPVSWIASLGAATVSQLASAVGVAAVMRLVGSKMRLKDLAYVAAVGAAASLASASLALTVVEVMRVDSRAVWMLLAPAAACAAALHAYSRQRRRHQHLAFLYRSMREIQQAPELESAIRQVLEAARTMLSADLAQIILLPREETASVLRGTLRRGGELSLEPIELDAMAALALEAVSTQQHAILLPRGRDLHVLDPYLAECRVPDGVIASVQREQGTPGLILVGERAGDIGTFTKDDAKLLETFASHAAVVLESDQVREQLRHQAFHDQLTGLPNRFLFAERVADALRQPPAEPARTAVLFLDLDDFKTINDSLGHSAGDELLVAVAARLQACAAPGAVAARLGGDEFAVLLPTATRDETDAYAARLLAAFDGFFNLHARELAIHPSIGIATADATTTTAEELLRNADVAMFSAKSNGKRSHMFFAAEMHQRAKRRHELVSTLEHALERDEIEAHYQPIVDLRTGSVFGFEALARWQHPDHGLLTAGSFMPLAEETGLAAGIGRIILSSSCRELARWQQPNSGARDLVMSVNLSPLELQNPRLTAEVEAMLEGYGVAPENLMLEVTESAAVRDLKTTVERLAEFRQLGIRIALDDFGTGYSSLSHLRELPIDVLKIAKPFVDALTSADEPFVKAIVQIAQALDLVVIAEGIEHRFQGDLLRDLDCQLAQGYHYGRPNDAAAAETFLQVAARQAWQETRERVRVRRRTGRGAADLASPAALPGAG